MKPSNVALALEQCMAIGRPAMLWGPPGIGKSDIVRQLASRMRAYYIAQAPLTPEAAADAQAAPAADGEYFGLLDYRAALRDAVDIMGLPGARDGVTYYNKPAGLPHDPAWRGIILLDEIVSAPPQTQAAMYQLILDRAVGEYQLPPGAYIVAAGNRLTDRGVVHRMPDPLVDRFLHIDVEPDLQDFCDWGARNGVASEVVAFLRFRPGLLHHHETTRKCHAITTPRGWVDVSRIIGLGSSIESELVKGRVGDGPAVEFAAFMRLCREMVSPDEVIRNPSKVPVPENPGVLYALSEALGRRADRKNLAAVYTFLRRMPKEYSQCAVSSMTRRDKTLCNTPEFIKWAADNA